MKWNKLGILLCSLLLFTGACAQTQEASGPSYHELLVYEYQSLDDAIKDTETIVEVKKTGKIENINDQHVDLTLTEFEVKDVYLGDSDLRGKTIRIMDLVQTSIGLHEKEEEYVLFLSPKTGRLGDDIYSIVGEYQGKFKIDSQNKLMYDADRFGGSKTFQESLEKLPLESISKLLIEK